MPDHNNEDVDQIRLTFDFDTTSWPEYRSVPTCWPAPFDLARSDTFVVRMFSPMSAVDDLWRLFSLFSAFCSVLSRIHSLNFPRHPCHLCVVDEKSKKCVRLEWKMRGMWKLIVNVFGVWKSLSLEPKSLRWCWEGLNSHVVIRGWVSATFYGFRKHDKFGDFIVTDS